MNCAEKRSGRLLRCSWVIPLGVLALDQLSLERRDPTPEQTFPRLIKLLECRDCRKRQGFAAVVSRYAEMYPKINLAPFRKELVRALNDTNVEIRLFIAGAAPVAEMVGPEILLESLQPALTNSDARVQRVARGNLERAGITNVLTKIITVQ